ncbi:hypothetical protein N431DRAFT_178230 [Stipitochalara longipes BDJ]|nr:hypothetical protein N431DRAFT_178230 [Stipitochalara longipes BDJ]
MRDCDGASAIYARLPLYEIRRDDEEMPYFKTHLASRQCVSMKATLVLSIFVITASLYSHCLKQRVPHVESYHRGGGSDAESVQNGEGTGA